MISLLVHSVRHVMIFSHCNSIFFSRLASEDPMEEDNTVVECDDDVFASANSQEIPTPSGLDGMFLFNELCLTYLDLCIKIM